MKERFLSVAERIERAALAAGRSPKEITLLAVSKLQSVAAMNEYARFCETRASTVQYGENYIQEFKRKKSELTGKYKTCFIGTLQRNKIRDAVRLFDCLESISTTALADAVNQEALSQNKSVEVLLQINISEDENKQGMGVESCLDIVRHVLKDCPGLLFKGLMCITKLYEIPEQARGDFRRMKKLYDQVHTTFKETSRPLILSMGMSSDFEIAIQEGATEVRIGTLLFGERG